MIKRLKDQIKNAKGSILKEHADFFGTSSQRLQILADRGVLIRDHKLFVRVRGKCNQVKSVICGVYLADWISWIEAKKTVVAEEIGVKRQQIDQWIEKDAFFFDGYLYISMALNEKKSIEEQGFDLGYMRAELKRLMRDLESQNKSSLKRYLVRLSEAV